MRREAIQRLESAIRDSYGLSVHLCGEIECYADKEPPPAYWEALVTACEQASVPLKDIARERGLHQYEFRLTPTAAVDAALGVEALKRCAGSVAESFALTVDFNALPRPDEPGSALHWHLHLADSRGHNVFLKQEDRLSPPLTAVLGGLLATMPALMPYFAPAEDSYKRLSSGADHVPTTVSWGGNNRTAALRLPESVVPIRHIEHRVCGADAEPYDAVWALLVGVHYGLTHRPDPGPQIFGRAGDAHYALPVLPMTAEAAAAAHDAAPWLREYLSFT